MKPVPPDFTEEQMRTWRAMSRAFKLIAVGIYDPDGDLATTVAGSLEISKAEAAARIASVLEVAAIWHEAGGLPDWM